MSTYNDGPTSEPLSWEEGPIFDPISWDDSSIADPPQSWGWPLPAPVASPSGLVQ